MASTNREPSEAARQSNSTVRIGAMTGVRHGRGIGSHRAIPTKRSAMHSTTRTLAPAVPCAATLAIPAFAHARRPGAQAATAFRNADRRVLRRNILGFDWSPAAIGAGDARRQTLVPTTEVGTRSTRRRLAMIRRRLILRTFAPAMGAAAALAASAASAMPAQDMGGRAERHEITTLQTVPLPDRVDAAAHAATIHGIGAALAQRARE
jgi:hypothetical protein